jgi:DNA topoisomerase-1
MGSYEDKDVAIGIGRFGPYVRHDSSFVSIPKDEDPYTITYDRSVELIEAKRKSDREKIIRIFEQDAEVKILKGRWGPYISFGKKNVRIPKDVEPTSLTYEDCVKLAELTPDKKRGAAAKSKAPKSKSKAKPKSTKKKVAAKKKS